MANENKKRNADHENWFEKCIHRAPSFCRILLTHKMLTVGLVTGVSALVGFAIAYRNIKPTDPPRGYFDQIFFKAIQIFVLEAGIERPDNLFLMIARVGAVILFVRFASGVFVKLFGDAWEQLRMDFAAEHTILCGLGRVGRQWFDDLEAKEKPHLAALQPMPIWLARLYRGRIVPQIVGIEPRSELPIVQQIRSAGGIVLEGKVTDRKILQRAGVLKARRVVIATGKDATNLELLFELIDFVKSQVQSDLDATGKWDSVRSMPANLECHVHILDPELADAITQDAESFPIKVTTFNAIRNGAQHLVTRYLTEHQYRPGRDQCALYVVIGLGHCGTAVALQIAELAHFSNLRRSRVLFVERDCAKAAESLLSQCGAFSPRAVETNWSKVKFDSRADNWDQRDVHPDEFYQTKPPGIEFICNAIFTERPSTISDEQFLRMIDRVVSDPSVKPVVIVCDDEEQDGLETALHLRQRFATRAAREVPVFVWMSRQEGLARFLRSETTQSRVVPFGSSKETVSVTKSLGLNTLKLAQKLHEDYCEKYSDGIASGKFAPWGRLAYEYRRSNISSAVHAWSKLAVFGIKQYSSKQFKPGYEAVGTLSAEKIEILAKMEHNRYVAERLRGGWRYGSVRNDSTREHPSLVPWESLSEDDRNKDRQQVQKLFELLESSTGPNAKSLYWIPPAIEFPSIDLDQITDATISEQSNEDEEGR